jgi:hypothetical protein
VVVFSVVEPLYGESVCFSRDVVSAEPSGEAVRVWVVAVEPSASPWMIFLVSTAFPSRSVPWRVSLEL